MGELVQISDVCILSRVIIYAWTYAVIIGFAGAPAMDVRDLYRCLPSKRCIGELYNNGPTWMTEVRRESCTSTFSGQWQRYSDHRVEYVDIVVAASIVGYE
jgi:hypothetical protein